MSGRPAVSQLAAMQTKSEHIRAKSDRLVDNFPLIDLVQFWARIGHFGCL